MRRLPLVVLALLVLAAAAWFVLRGRSSSADDLAARSCSALETAARRDGSVLRAELEAAVRPARDAAVKSKRFAPLSRAVARLAGAPAAPGVGTVARPADLATSTRTCKGTGLAGRAAIVTRAPYLTDVTDHSVIVNFATDRRVGRAVVSYGPAGSGCRASRAAASTPATAITVRGRREYLHAVALTGLSPGTRYCYRLGPDTFDLSSREVPPEVMTAPAANDSRPYSFAVIGDWGGGTMGEARVLSRIAAGPASFVVTTGDNAYIGGTQSDYGDLDRGNVFASHLWPMIGERLPTFATQGNHGFSNFRAELENWPERESVRSSAGAYQPDEYCCIPTLLRPHTYASTWYAFDRGPVRFYILDAAWADHTGHYAGDYAGHWTGPVAGCGPCGAELAWLRADLAAHASTPIKLAFFHYPPYVDASDHLPDQFLAGPDRLEGLLARAGVDLVFNGHAHLYERNLPQIPGSRLVTYVTGGGGVGTGSDRLARVRGCSAYDAYAIGVGHTSCHAPPVDDAAVYHYLLVTVDGNRVTVTPTDAFGRTFDVQTYDFSR